MTLEEYQKEAEKTAFYPEVYRVLYPALGLVGEAGEVANKVKKILRDHEGALPPDLREALLDELGDVLWYAALLARDLGASLEAVAEGNLRKLASRKARGALKGSGDDR